MTSLVPPPWSVPRAGSAASSIGSFQQGNLHSLIAEVKACGRCKDIRRGKALHEAAMRLEVDSDVYLGNSLIGMYVKCGMLTDADCVFQRMPRVTVVSWNALILGYAVNGEGQSGIRLFAEMHASGYPPDDRTFAAALKACTAVAAKGTVLQAVRLGMALHSEVVSRGHQSDSFVANTLLSMYAACGRTADARKVFECSDLGVQSDVVPWNALLLGYVENGDAESALDLFTRGMLPSACPPSAQTLTLVLNACSVLTTEKHVSKQEILQRGLALHREAVSRGFDTGVYVASTLVDLYAKCGKMLESRRVFEKMRQRTVVSWTALMLGYAENGDADEVLFLYSRMMQEKDCAPNAFTFAVALKACAALPALEAGRRIHSDAARSGAGEDQVVATALVDLYGKCGSMGEAEEVFDSVPAKDVRLWTSLMAGYSYHGNTTRVLELFHSMRDRGLKPDGVTFVCILTACTHAGMVDTGRAYFDAMEPKFGIAPAHEHYSCMVDLLSRSNRLEEALTVVKAMHFEPSPAIWMTLLGGCSKWKNVEVGKLAFESVLRLGVHDSAAYALMANIYST